MTRYASFDPSSSPPHPVIGWYDTEEFVYPTLPDLTHRLELTDEQWHGRMVDPSAWAVNGNDLVPYTHPTPPPTPDQALASKISDGIAITCSGDAAVSATYALDAQTMTEVGSVARDAASGLGLPGGGETFIYPDKSGQPHAFTSARLIALYQAMRNLLWVLSTQAGIMKQGGTPTWPDQSAVIA